MDLDQRFRPNNGLGGRIILLGDGTEISSDGPESEMFDHEDEDNDLDSQVDKYNKDASNSNESNRDGTPGPSAQSSTAQVTESPSSVQTEKSDAPEQALKDAQGSKKPVADTTAAK